MSPSASNLANQVDAIRFNQTITGSRVELTVNEDKVLLHNKKKALSKSLDSNTEILALNFTDSYTKKLEKNMGVETSYGRVDAGCDTQTFELMSATSKANLDGEWPAPMTV